jgi:hypothetical protein
MLVLARRPKLDRDEAETKANFPVLPGFVTTVLAIAGEECPNAPFTANEPETSDRRRPRHRLRAQQCERAARQGALGTESFEIGGRTEIQTISFHTSEFVLYIYPLAGSTPQVG